MEESRLIIPKEAEAARDVVCWVLGEIVVGVYLFSSSLTDGLRTNSNVDLLVIVSKQPAEWARLHLVTELMTVSGRAESKTSPRPVEMTLIRLEDLVPWRYPPRVELFYSELFRVEYEFCWVPPPENSPSLTILLTDARAQSIELAGPELAGLIPPIPREVVRRAIADIHGN